MTHEKTCTKCLASLSVAEFSVDARYRDGLANWCRRCKSEYRREHHQRNKAHDAARNSAWYAANRDAVSLRSHANYELGKDRHAARVKAAKARRPDHYRKVAAERRRARIASDPAAALRARISSQIYYCLSTGKGGKTTRSLVGYSMDELRAHLERQFTKGMSWGNMGKWHIDHIVPLASFTITGPCDPELRRAWSLPNLRPPWAAENIAKRDKRVTLL